jgi:hypothetical protein
MRVLTRPVVAAFGVAVAVSAVHAPAHAAFSGDFAPANWTFTQEGNVGGSVNTSGAPGSIALTSPNQGTVLDPKPGTSLYTITAPATRTRVTFDWSLVIGQDEALADNDPFGFVRNGTRTQLSDDFAGDQAGSFSTTVAPGDSFGFYAATVDGRFGGSTTTVSNFTTAQVPGPLPVLGAIVAFRTSRKLRARLRDSANRQA